MEQAAGLGARLQHGKGHDQGAAQRRAGPESGRGPLPVRPGADQRGRQWQHTENHAGVHRFHVAHRNRGEQRKAEHRPGGNGQDQRPVARCRSRRTGEGQEEEAQDAGHRGAPEGHEPARQLRRVRRTHRQPGHGQRQREDQHADQAQPKAAHFVGTEWRVRAIRAHRTLQSIHTAVSTKAVAMQRLNTSRRWPCASQPRSSEPVVA
jgi:hypothetical protein